MLYHGGVGGDDSREAEVTFQGEGQRWHGSDDVGCPLDKPVLVFYDGEEGTDDWVGFGELRGRRRRRGFK